MEIPSNLFLTSISEGQEFFFKMGCPIGIQDHIHICIKKENSILIFSTCSSQIEKAKLRIKALNLEPKSYPIFQKDDINQFHYDTYLDCNKVTEVSVDYFYSLIQQGKIVKMNGVISESGMQIIREGILCSNQIEEKYKDLFR